MDSSSAKSVTESNTTPSDVCPESLECTLDMLLILTGIILFLFVNIPVSFLLGQRCGMLKMSSKKKLAFSESSSNSSPDIRIIHGNGESTVIGEEERPDVRSLEAHNYQECTDIINRTTLTEHSFEGGPVYINTNNGRHTTSNKGSKNKCKPDSKGEKKKFLQLSFPRKHSFDLQHSQKQIEMTEENRISPATPRLVSNIPRVRSDSCLLSTGEYVNEARSKAKVTKDSKKSERFGKSGRLPDLSGYSVPATPRTILHENSMVIPYPVPMSGCNAHDLNAYTLPDHYENADPLVEEGAIANAADYDEVNTEREVKFRYFPDDISQTPSLYPNIQKELKMIYLKKKI